MIISSPGLNPELTVHVVTGRVTVEELIEAATSFLEGAPTRLALWDLCQADFSGIPTASVQSIFNSVAPFKERRRGGKSALLFASTEGFGLGRIGEAMAEIRGFPFEVRAFSDRREAMLWLEMRKEEEHVNGGEGVA
jgi:hypothetical protein